MDRYEFIWKAIQKHGYKYDYRKVDYVNYSKKVCIICPIHGEFWQTPSNHLHKNKYGCSKCANNVNYTTEEFIEKAKLVHKDKYDYSKVEYVDVKTKVCIICPVHGEFWQRPHGHLSGKGCEKCGLLKNNGEMFIKNELIKHFNEDEILYQFRDKHILNRLSLDFYLPSYNIAIECQGEQHFKPVDHFGGEKAFLKTIERDEKKYHMCKEHNIELIYYFFTKTHNDGKYFGKIFYNTDDLISYILTKNYIKANIKHTFAEKANLIHGNKYDYSKVKYKGSHNKVCIICPEHGEFWQRLSSHLNGCGCPTCGIKSYTSNTKEFIEKAKLIHGNKYDYSKINYVRSSDKVCIICQKHGEFLQSPDSHLRGYGCPKCKQELLSSKNTSTTDKFIEKANKVWNYKYDYSKVNYINSKTKVCIICPINGEFWQEPHRHLSGRKYNFKKKIC